MKLSLSGFERLAKKAGVKRIAIDAVEELRDALQEYSESVAKQAVELSKHAGRRTVKKEDILFVTSRQA